jgi:hypothetical protein
VRKNGAACEQLKQVAAYMYNVNFVSSYDEKEKRKKKREREKKTLTADVTTRSIAAKMSLIAS